MEAAKNAVNNLLNRGGGDDDSTTTGNTTTTGQSGNLGTTGTGTGTSISTNYGAETADATPGYTRDDEYIDRYGATGKGAGSGATAQVDSGSTTTGTALGGRVSGNTPDSASRAKATGGGTEDADGYSGRDSSLTSTGEYGAGVDSGFDSSRPARPIGTEPTAYHQVTGSADGTPSSQYGIGKTSVGVNTSASGQKLTDGAADYRTGSTLGSGVSDVGSGVGTGVGSGYAANRDTTGISSETYPQTSTSHTSGIPGVASGDTYPRSGDLSSHSRTETGYRDDQPRSGDLSTARTATITTDERKDPAVVSESRSRLTGSGEDGSHSAVFGLTPDGHTFDDTSHHSGGLKPAHSKSYNDTSDRRDLTGGDTVADQMNDLRVNQRGDGKDPTYNVGSNTKPGAGFQAGSPDQSL